MSYRPLIVPAFAPSRSVLLAASFAGCGVLLLLLFMALIGCTSFGTTPEVKTIKPDSPNAETRGPNVPNAVLCECTCDAFVEAVPPPSPNTIKVSADDGTQVGAGNLALDRALLELGGSNNVGLRFLKLGVPGRSPGAPSSDVEITDAHIQFTAFEKSQTGNLANFDIVVVDSANADPFTLTTDLREGQGLTFVSTVVNWSPVPDWALNEGTDNEKTPNLKDLVQKIVDHDGYTHDSSIAFVIRGSGRRVARSFDSTGPGRAPTLHVTYQPKKIKQDFMTCGDPNDQANVCGGKLQSNVSDIGSQCKQTSTCSCKVKQVADADKTSFSQACNLPCPKLVAPTNCDPALIAQTTAATENHTQVCVATSPLGSLLFGQASACDIDQSQSTVFMRIFDGDDSVSDEKPARGRVEFINKPCSGPACVGMRHRMNVNPMTFKEGGLIGFLDGDHNVTDLTAIGESTLNASLDAGGAGTFGSGFTKHSLRGTGDGDIGTVAVLATNNVPLAVGLNGFVPNGLCTLEGRVLLTDHLEMVAHIKGKLVNQPPTAVLGPEDPVECNDTGRALFELDGSADDPDKNIASFAWFRDSRTGPQVGTRSSVELEQPLGTTSYVFKVIDTFGQYADATTQITVVDTVAPTVTPPSDRKAECTGPAGTALPDPPGLGTATATDVCDASPTIKNDAPQLFPLGTTMVHWTAKDGSGNTGMATQQVKIEDTTPPDLKVVLSPSVLWPPDHRLVPITATISVTDTCDPNPTVKLISITSNEPDNGLGDGDTAEDIQQAAFGTDDRTFKLRAERSGRGNGRIYTVTYQAMDASGNTTAPKTATVIVPKSQAASK